MGVESEQRRRKARRVVFLIIGTEVLVGLAVGLAVGLSQHSFGWAILAVLLLGVAFTVLGVAIVATTGGKAGVKRLGRTYAKAYGRAFRGLRH